MSRAAPHKLRATASREVNQSDVRNDASGRNNTAAPPHERNVIDIAAAILRSREQMQQAIATAAYLRAEQRGFEPGHELEDWLDAQAEIAGKRSSG